MVLRAILAALLLVTFLPAVVRLFGSRGSAALGMNGVSTARLERAEGGRSTFRSRPPSFATLVFGQRPQRFALPLTYLAAITGAELATALVDPLLGIILHVLILAALIIHASAVPGQLLHKLLVALSLAPLIRILSLSFPLEDVDQVYWYAIIAVPLFVAIMFIASTIGLKRRGLGLAVRNLRLQALVASSGLAFGIVEYFILKPEPLITELTWGSFLIPAVILLVGTGFTEELAFRGVLQSAAVAALGTGALIYVAAVFAVMHIGYRSPIDVAFVFCIGLFYGWVVARTRSLVGVALSHGIANIVLFLWVPHTPISSL